MRLTLVPVFVLLLSVFASCNKADNSFRDQFRWLSGKWEARIGESLTIEQWKWNKYRFEGFAFEIINGDTTLKEQLFLQSFAGKAGYTVIVNGDGPYTFGLDKKEGNTYSFLNADHDFPSVIQYTLESDTALIISLFEQGKVKDPNVTYKLKRTVRSFE